MTYVAIARKWRPTMFEDIVGQEHVTRTLQNAIRLDRVHHAFLFTGARGVGKTTAARVLARALNCAAGEGPTPTPCGECHACRAISSGSNSDVIEIDGASNNSVDDVRDLRDAVRYLPQGRMKVYIVDEVHMLSRGAFNALLKTLEEPPPHVVFIFATTEPHKIPDTILSRVQRFDFKRIPLATVVSRLQTVCAGEGMNISEGGLRLIARAGEGSMRDAQSLLDRVVSFAGPQATTEQVAEVLGLVDRRLLYQMLEGVVQGEPDRCLHAIDAVDAYGFDMSEFTGEILELLRNATLVGLSPESGKFVDVPEDEREHLQKLSQAVTPDVLVRSFHVMLDVHDQVARAPRPRLVLEMAVARLVAIRPARSIDQVLERIDLLQRRVLHQVGSNVRGSKRSPSNDPEGDSRPHAQPPLTGSETPTSPAFSFARKPLIQPRAAEVAATDQPVEPVVFERREPLRAPTPPPASTAVAEPIQFERKSPLLPPEVPVYDDVDIDMMAFERRELLRPTEVAFEEYFDDPDLPMPVFDGDILRPAAPVQATEDLSPPAPIRAQASTPERFEAFQKYLERGGPTYDAIAFDCAMVSTQGANVQLVCSSPFKLGLAVAAATSERVSIGLRHLFVGVESATVKLRPEGSGPETRRERLDRERKERIADLTNQLANLPIHGKLGSIFGARVRVVVPADENPPLKNSDLHGRK